MNKKAILWVGLVLSVMALLYCALWVIQSAWLSATPDYPLERAKYYFNISASLTILFFFVSVALGFVLYRGRKRNNETIERIKKIEEEALRKLGSQRNE